MGIRLMLRVAVVEAVKLAIAFALIYAVLPTEIENALLLYLRK